MGAGKYRKRPIIVEAMQIDDGTVPRHEHLGTAAEVAEWCGGEYQAKDGQPRVKIPTMHGQISAYPSDWVIRGIVDFYPMPAHQFPRMYDLWVPDDTEPLLPEPKS